MTENNSNIDPKNKIIEYFDRYQFKDEHEHDLTLCADFVELVELATKHKLALDAANKHKSAIYAAKNSDANSWGGGVKKAVQHALIEITDCL